METSALTILIPLDGSSLADQALPHAQAIAEDGARLVLLRVVPEPEPIRDLFGRIIVPADAAGRWAGDTAREGLDATAAELRRDGPAAVKITTEVRTGDAADQILRVAGERGADLIVMAGHGRGAIGRVAFGSVADRVTHASPIPVMIVRPTDAAAESGPAPMRRFIVPLDGSELAARALPIAEELARRLSLPVVLMRAVDTAQFYGLLGDALVIPQEALGDAEEDARHDLEKTAGTLREAGVAATTEVWIGPPFAAIAEATRPGDVVVLTSHGRTGVSRWLLGSVAEKLVRSGPAPVILVPVGARAKERAAAGSTAPFAMTTE